MSERYNGNELLICLSARVMEDRSSAFIGTGVPMLAAALAKRLYAPDLVSVFEFGGIGSSLDYLPRGVGESKTFYRALVATGICDVMETAARGFVTYGFLGGAQIDMYGNLNSTVIGDYEQPKVRLPGSGGGNDVGSFCWRTIAIMRHEAHRFIPELDFLTTPGYLTGPGAREAAGLYPDTGPYRVITDLATLGYEEESKRMMLLALNPGVTVDQVVENTGFELVIPAEVGANAEPTDEELKALREEIDPDGLYI